MQKTISDAFVNQRTKAGFLFIVAFCVEIRKVSKYISTITKLCGGS